MVADIHYNDEMLQRLVNNQLSHNKELEITEHVELCEECLAKLELLSEQNVNWNNVRRMLHAPMMDTLFSEATTVEITTSTHELRAIEYLLPSEHPKSLGRFGRYEIEEVLGRGGMGVVLKGFDPELNRYSAIKVLASELATSASARSRFSREAKSAAAVIHEHVIPIQTVNEERGLPYLVMPVIEGQSLQQRIAQQGPLELKEVLRIGMQIASGLGAAHDQGLVHRDIKPANILLENGVERVMITDFGLARAADDANMTQSGVISGTPQYMSPEQARGCSIDHRSDLFSLGSVLYAMFTGHSPFRAETTMGVLNRITNDDPRSVSSINSDVPLWMQSIIERLLEKNPEDRFQSATEVADLLGTWLKHLQQPDVVPPPAPTPTTNSVNSGPPLSRWLIGAAAGAFLFFVGIFIVIETNKGTLTIESPLDKVPVLIRRVKDGNIAKELTLEQGPNSTRIAAGEYEIEIKGSDFDLLVVDGKVTITARGTGGAKLASPTNAFPPGPGVLAQPAKQVPLTRIFRLQHISAEQLPEKIKNELKVHVDAVPKDSPIFDNLSISIVTGPVDSNAIWVSANELGMVIIKELIKKWDKEPVHINIGMPINLRFINSNDPICHGELNWYARRPIPWQIFAQVEYVGPHRSQHVPEYRLRVDDEIDFVYRFTWAEPHAAYQLNVGDQIRVESLTDENINRELMIQPDGSITVLLLGQVHAAGKTVAEVTKELEEGYLEYYKVPAITVTPLLVNTRLEDLRESVDGRAGFNGQSRRGKVTPEGTIQLPAIGPVPAQGLTLDELKREIDERYNLFVEGVEVSPILVPRAPRYVYVIGEVSNPGRFELTGPTTAIQVLALSGGWNNGTNLREIVIFRRVENGRLIATKIDLKGALYGKRPAPPDELWLRDTDIIVVPKSPTLFLDESVDLVFTRGGFSPATFSVYPRWTLITE